MDPALLQSALRRAGIILVLSFVFVFAFSELAYRLTGSTPRRDPQEILLVIPPGTANKIALGQPEPSLPASMEFLVGDTLVVDNQDSVTHQLGPLFIPAGTRASLPLQIANDFEYDCSFQPTQLFGLDVRQPATFDVRLFAIAYATPATAVFIFVYSLVVFPLKKKEPNEAHP